jgi:hypothetical protein
MKWNDAFVIQDLKPYELNMKFRAIRDILNGRISFGNIKGIDKNIDGVLIEHLFPVLGVDNTINHDLKIIPTGYIILKSSNGGVIYDGSIRWTKSEITLRSTTNNHAATLFLVR